MKLFRFLFMITLVMLHSQMFAQVSTSPNKIEKIQEDLIEHTAFQLLNSTDDDKSLLNQELKDLLIKELKKEDAFEFPFSKVESISILTSPDSAFRLFNWNIPFSNGTYKYECYILHRESEKLIPLIEWEFDTMNIDKVSSPKGMWVPCLYYSIIAKETKLQTYYTLLGWKGNNLLSTKKIIDVLWFDQEEEPRYGAPIFWNERDKKSRIIFEFGAQNTMRLYYDEKFDRIQFEHLAPSQPSLTGVFEYYGSDLSFDAYQWKRNRWELKSDIDVDQGKGKRKKDFKIKEDVILKEEPIYRPN